MAKRKIDTSKMEITDKFLQSLFERCNGKRRHYLILTDEHPDFLYFLEEEGWIKTLNNSERRPWYTATVKLIEKFRQLSKEEVKQIQNQLEEEAAFDLIDKEELERATKAIAERGPKVEL